MALSANTANVQILEDNSTTTVVKMWLHQQTAGDEADVLKVNTATLVGRTIQLQTSNGAPGQSGFQLGEKVTGGTSGAVGYVLSWERPSATANGQLSVVVDSGTFQTSEVISGTQVPTYAPTILNITTPVYMVHIRSISYSVNGTAKVELAFDDSGTKRPAVILSGSGYIGANELPSRIPNTAAVPNGNLYVSTYGVGNLGGYTVIVELRKGTGFASRPGY